MTDEINHQITKKCPHCQSDVNLKAKKCPHCQSDIRSWGARYSILILIGVLILLVLNIDRLTGNRNNNPPQTVVQQSAQEETKMVFNIPTLIDKNISEIKSVLGIPTDDYHPSENMLNVDPNTPSAATYKKNGFDLMINYSQSGKVIEIFLGKDTNSESELLQAGGLDKNNQLYSTKLQPCILNCPAKYTGIHIYPSE